MVMISFGHSFDHGIMGHSLSVMQYRTLVGWDTVLVSIWSRFFGYSFVVILLDRLITIKPRTVSS